MTNKLSLFVAVVLIAAGASGLWLNRWTRAHVVEVLRHLSHGGAHGDSLPTKPYRSAANRSRIPGDRTLTLKDEQIQAIGLKTVDVKTQTAPTPLRLSGITDYDPATVTIVRTQFDVRVDKVLVNLGDKVRVGQPLLELFSNDLAEAKSNYEVTSSQWDHDKAVLDYKTPLAKDDALPRSQLIEVQNDEKQSRLKMKLAKDKLLVYGLTEKEIENAKNEDGVRKAAMILKSQADGVVVLRQVVPGNYYTSADLLMTIAQLDHLWVRGSVSELDAEQIEQGQKLRVIFPFSDRTLTTRVDYIDKAIDAESRSAKFRSTIPNEGSRLKAGMFVRVWVELSPKPGRTVIPRIAMVSVDNSDFVFVKKKGTSNQFERRSILAEIEKNDIVIVTSQSSDHPGLDPGEEVVTIGSLILEQMYEDAVTSEGGLLSSRMGGSTVEPLDEPGHVVLSTDSRNR